MSAMCLTGRRLQGLAISIALAAAGYLAFAFWGGWQDVISAFGAVGVTGLVLALILSLVNYGLRFVRWQYYLGELGVHIPVTASALTYVAGFALTTTPGKAGEMLRGVFLKSYGMTFTHSTAAFVSERLSDLTAVVLLALLGVTLQPGGSTILLAGMLVVTLGLVILSRGNMLATLSSRLADRSGRLARAIQHVLTLLMEARRCHAPRLLLIATVLSVMAWSSEACAFYLILHWLSFDVSLPYAISVYALAMLAGALSFLPGGLGGAEAVMVGLLLWKGMPEAQAVAATVIIRLATLWFAVALGVLALLLGGRFLAVQQPGS
ncbi:lysylphosphatidylglycerol synthase transmembrane domain-containing protein [Desulfurispora thermophila]|uniref:lysylphosphatidylglycerol synthase transmembrane domain-containing protein n=1 Tax=Desulfurispora thermophila TaxID=265470 RepID=UPI000382D203|nr:lysylphosphatidylglycerol synthase transmembrane domain-containing protein [Desulfurispora thermophila]